jgi:hypothetical protein
VTPVALVIELLIVVVLWLVGRRFMSARASAAFIASGVLVAALAAWLAAPGGFITGTLVGWELASAINAPFTSQTTTIGVVVDHPGCTASSGGDWLGEPVIAYTPSSVTITMHARDTLPDDVMCHTYYLSGEWVEVKLSQPLGDRQLFDGSKSPPHLRTQGDTPFSMSR